MLHSGVIKDHSEAESKQLTLIFNRVSVDCEPDERILPLLSSQYENIPSLYCGPVMLGRFYKL